MSKEKQNKTIRLKGKPLTNKDLWGRKFPKSTLTLVNEYGQLIIGSVEIQLETSGDYNSLPFFYSKLLPLMIPNYEDEEELPKKKGGYVG